MRLVYFYLKNRNSENTQYLRRLRIRPIILVSYSTSQFSQTSQPALMFSHLSHGYRPKSRSQRAKPNARSSPAPTLSIHIQTRSRIPNPSTHLSKPETRKHRSPVGQRAKIGGGRAWKASRRNQSETNEDGGAGWEADNFYSGKWKGGARGRRTVASP